VDAVAAFRAQQVDHLLLQAAPVDVHARRADLLGGPADGQLHQRPVLAVDDLGLDDLGLDDLAADRVEPLAVKPPLGQALDRVSPDREAGGAARDLDPLDQHRPVRR
jgi:hypothetical protein